MSAAQALGMRAVDLALELTNRDAPLMATADGWEACEVADLQHVDFEDGYFLWQSVQDHGDHCYLYGLTTLLDGKAKSLEFLGSDRIYAWHVHVSWPP